MTEHKFTDEEVIKALELCFTQKGTTVTCAKCPYHPFGKMCKVMRDKDALDLINRQKADVAYWMDTAANAKKEAVNEFADRLKARKTSMCSGHGMSSDFVYIGHIDTVAKEMMGEQA